MAFTCVKRDRDETRPGSLRCLVVDHQTAALEQLARMLRAHPDVVRVSTATDSLSALRVLHHHDVDVAFIEVRLPGLDGMELAWVLKRLRSAPAVVFVSGCPQRAAEAFDLGAVDYLHKPPPAARLAESVRRVVAVQQPAGPAPARPHPPAADDGLIPVELAGTTKLVPRSDVRWAQAHRDYVRLHTADGSYLIRARLSALADSWRAAGMVRIHRSYLVRSRLITAVHVDDSGSRTVVVDGRRLPVSRRMAPTLRADLLREASPDPDRLDPGHGCMAGERPS